jgi:hypothetical protein
MLSSVGSALQGYARGGARGEASSLGWSTGIDRASHLLANFVPTVKMARDIAGDLIGRYLDQVHEAVSREREACGGTT